MSLRFVLGACVVFAGFAAATAAEFRFKALDDKSLGLWEGDKPVFVYNHGIISKAGVPADRARSTYVHPLYGMDGEVLTDDFPKDHYHHRGLFWAWPHVKVGGKEYDLWMLKGVEQRFEKFLATNATSKAMLGVQNGWYVGSRWVMSEQVTLTVHPAEGESRAIDISLVLTAEAEPVSLTGAEGKSYGGLTLRFAPRTNTVITTPLGNGDKDLPMTRLAWADLTAQYPGVPQPSGAAILVSPKHPDFPPMWLTRHYGVLCLGWPGTDGKSLEPTRSTRLEYRLWIHRGTVDLERMKAVYADYEKAITASN